MKCHNFKGINVVHVLSSRELLKHVETSTIITAVIMPRKF